MFILFGTKESGSEPVAVFEMMPLLSAYVNALAGSMFSSEIDPLRREQSVLTGCTDQQTVSVAQVWATHEDWVKQLEAAKLCPFNPVCSVVSRGELEAKQIKLQARRDALDVELASVSSMLTPEVK